ncbi:MAG: hypothetical protein A2836_03425 [Candidatus Taylorbacteria bacterium RIFCSPHIGHO2_01_FULL_45_63]|uniref:GTPase Obg n=1 Tax=Candidatus Taylorbacteria bacterium RIFCSPHIGHO2_02_FULL_45_35 TaxID=1802311 RepID=A0A1G2MRB7_9BACT|nr:MAG: hypothetical protein A2836_03425 [Candidatus Taylorbacteria bacterium RIFCSPHIGHO2_01_FULL_45_63]OHA25759.1 MAG: hypothetical protein A3D56_02390 [Candidatus Taylorbacteria bacterium RIFCSPHIGHO2_02_FULL_45_35]OHA34107.1 MAG: hypothetical protein A3A22_02475 [Candidatus Taylorbacteria bacterium RIFCSPLOWO2_01_FULL_45_34b]
MAFVDEIKLRIEAGHGGNGVVRWLHEKGKEYGGPSGGNAGKGGDIYGEAIRDVGILARYRTVKVFKAERGGDGEKNGRHGKNGEDLVIPFPLGSVITNLATRRKVELLKDGEKVLLLSGGRGGLGNKFFKSSVNVRPKEFTQGEKGEGADFQIELELIADAGLIGLPNAGKSSLLNALTNASAKVGSYKFTTLEPNLGALFGFVLADIPGLIEGASEGRGLGHKFLRHIRRTKILLHCISLEEADIAGAYKTIRDELKKYDAELAAKKEIILLTKADLFDKAAITSAKKKAEKLNKKVLVTSSTDAELIKKLSDSLVKILKEE